MYKMVVILRIFWFFYTSIMNEILNIIILDFYHFIVFVVGNYLLSIIIIIFP